MLYDKRLAKLQARSTKQITAQNVKNSLNIIGFFNDKNKVKLAEGLLQKADFDQACSVSSSKHTPKGNYTETFLYTSLSSKGIFKSSDVLLVGTGGPTKSYAQALLNMGGNIAKQLSKSNAAKVALFVDTFVFMPKNKKERAIDFSGRELHGVVDDSAKHAELLITGILLGLYKFNRYTKTKDYVPTVNVVSSKLPSKRLKELCTKARTVADGVYFARDLQTTPGMDLVPDDLAKHVKRLAKETALKVTVFDEKKLKSMGMNGLLKVGMGSNAKPRLIMLEYNSSKKNFPLISFVGKGITYDTGGYSLKPPQNMVTMKKDLSGAAAVLSAAYVIAALKLPVRLKVYVPSAENMVNGEAIRPGDIYTAYNGKTIEVLNTDAEGRLVLADALSYASEAKPDCLINVATLTGSCIGTFGDECSAIMGNNYTHIQKVKEASERIGEKVWELPIQKTHLNDLRSPIADYKNIASVPYAGAAKAGAFLSFFINKKIPWAHLDIAGTAMGPKGQGAHCPANVGTGIVTRALVEFADSF